MLAAYNNENYAQPSVIVTPTDYMIFPIDYMIIHFIATSLNITDMLVWRD
jgi:hypothetical protein